MSKQFKQILILICLISLLVLPYFVFAEELESHKQGSDGTSASESSALNNLKNVGTGGGYQEATETTISSIVGVVIKAFLSILGMIFIGLMIIAGYNYMIAQGDQERVKKALAMIRYSITGLVIIIGAYAIWNFIAKYLIQ